MPRKSRFPEYNKYVIIYGSGTNVVCLNYSNAKAAVEAYRIAVKTYGDDVRLTKVVLDYGDTI